MIKYLSRYTLLLLLLLLPFGAALYLLVAETNEDIAFAQKERVGMRYHRALFDTLVAIEDYRGKWDVAVLSGHDSPDLPVLKEQVTGRIKAVDALSADAVELGVADAWQKTRTQLIEAKEETLPESATALPEWDRAPIISLASLMQQVGNRSNLVLDPQIETYYMVNVTVNIVPNIVEQLGFMRRKISGALAGGKIAHQEMHMLIASQGKLAALGKLYQESITTIEENDPENVSNKAEREIGALASLTKTTALFEAIVEHPENVIPHEDFFAHMSATLEKYEEIYNRFSDHLAWHLNERVSERQAYRLKMIVLLSFALGFALLVLWYARKNMVKHEELTAAKKLKESEERLQLAVSGSSDGLWDHNVVTGEVYYAPSFMALTGHAPDEFPHRIETWIELMHPDDRDPTLQAVQRYFKERGPFSVEYRLRHKDGHYIWCSARGQATWNEQGEAIRMTGFTMDISARKKAEALLKASEERLKLAIDGSADGLWDWNVITGEVYYSPRFMALTGHTPNELPHHIDTWTELMHPDDRALIHQAVQRYFKERGSYSVEYRLRHKDGHYIWCSARGQATWNEQGEAVRMTGFTMDISERKKSAEKLAEYATQMEMKSLELAGAKELAEQATQLKSEFLANMSHEIRTPMNGIIGMTNLLLDTNLDATQRSYAETVTNSADALLQIINDILDFSKIEAGKIDLEQIPFDLQLLCEEVCEMMSFKAHAKGIELLLRYPHGTPRFCIGDPGRVRQILFNLVGNSIKFTDNGHVILALQWSKTDNGALKFHVTVEDTGIGIPADKVDLIFNKFSQADQSTARKFGGTGLGLSICKELCRLMGGDIGVRSTYGIGSTFWFEMVLGEDTAEAGHFSVPQDEVLRGLRILVVDDNASARSIIREQMLPYGIDIVESHSGDTALALLARDSRFDIAILDYMMAHMDGATLGQAIKTNPKTRDISLLMITSNPNRGDKRHLEEIGFAGYLSKPLASWHLRDAVAAIASARKSGTAIPMVTQHSLKEAKAGIQQKTGDMLHFTNVHILLAEDNPVNQTVATTILEKYGCKITPAGDGDEAVKQLKQRSFDLVFMDCQMPVMDGFEATEMIRRMEIHQKRARTPVIAFTANAMKGDSERCFFAGMDDYIAKPVRQADLERILMQWIPPEKRTESARTTERKGEALSSDATAPVLDMAIVNHCASLMGDGFSGLLARHLEIADGYVQAIRTGFDTADYNMMMTAAHPLKSASYQVGAVKIADIARKIEHLARVATPDIAQLATLAAQAEAAQTETHQAFASHLESSAA